MSGPIGFQQREVKFDFYTATEGNHTHTRTIVGDDDMVTWVAMTYADVNNCGVIASIDGVTIATVGNVQQ